MCDIAENIEVKIFLAGSKELETQRAICQEVFQKKQTYHRITIISKSFEDFNDSATADGRQNGYNKFISEKADALICIFDERVGEESVKEIYVGMRAYLQNKKKKLKTPQVYIYFNKQNLSAEELKKAILETLKEKRKSDDPDDEIRNDSQTMYDTVYNALASSKQYFIEYDSDDERKGLRARVEDSIDKFVKEKRKEQEKEHKEFQKNVKIFICTFLALVVGGFFYMKWSDDNMSDFELKQIARDHIKRDKYNSNIYYYITSRETFIYDSSIRQVSYEHKDSNIFDLQSVYVNNRSEFWELTSIGLIAKKVLKKSGNNKGALLLCACGPGIGMAIEQKVYPTYESARIKNWLENWYEWEDLINPPKPRVPVNLDILKKNLNKAN